jgi:hypothetical protein
VDGPRAPALFVALWTGQSAPWASDSSARSAGQAARERQVQCLTLCESSADDHSSFWKCSLTSRQCIMSISRQRIKNAITGCCPGRHMEWVTDSWSSQGAVLSAEHFPTSFALDCFRLVVAQPSTSRLRLRRCWSRQASALTVWRHASRFVTQGLVGRPCSACTASLRSTKDAVVPH